jgi:hypothetical protein
MNMAEESVAIGMRDTVCKEPSGSALFLTFWGNRAWSYVPPIKSPKERGIRDKLLMENVSNFLHNSATSIAGGGWNRHRYGPREHSDTGGNGMEQGSSKS